MKSWYNDRGICFFPSLFFFFFFFEYEKIISFEDH